jgi:hypothetical protein
VFDTTKVYQFASRRLRRRSPPVCRQALVSRRVGTPCCGEDALTILPPTRRYTDAEVRKALAERGVDGVLLTTVADSGVVSPTPARSYSRRTAAQRRLPAPNGQWRRGRYERHRAGRGCRCRYAHLPLHAANPVLCTAARAKRRSSPVGGDGQVDSGGGRGLLSRIAVSDSLSSSNAIGAIFGDFQAKGLIGGGSS